MLTGYRGIILALGLILTGASPPGQRGQDQQHDSQPTAEHSLRDIAAALQDANKSDGTTKPCPKDQEDRSSDLCAQWKAADAAGASAVWTERTFWLGIGGFAIGLLTFGAATAAAIFAKKAAVETEKGANAALGAVEQTREANALTRDHARIELRAYVAIDRIAVTALFPNTTAIQFALKNFGATPASNIKFYAVAFEGVHPMNQPCSFIEAVSRSNVQPTLAAGGTALFKVFQGGPFDRDRIVAMQADFSLYVHGRVEYEDVFGQQQQTTFCYRSAVGEPDEDWLVPHPTGNTAT